MSDTMSGLRLNDLRSLDDLRSKLSRMIAEAEVLAAAEPFDAAAFDSLEVEIEELTLLIDTTEREAAKAERVAAEEAKRVEAAERARIREKAREAKRLAVEEKAAAKAAKQEERRVAAEAAAKAAEAVKRIKAAEREAVREERRVAAEAAAEERRVAKAALREEKAAEAERLKAEKAAERKLIREAKQAEAAKVRELKAAEKEAIREQKRKAKLCKVDLLVEEVCTGLGVDNIETVLAAILKGLDPRSDKGYYAAQHLRALKAARKKGRFVKQVEARIAKAGMVEPVPWEFMVDLDKMQLRTRNLYYNADDRGKLHMGKYMMEEYREWEEKKYQGAKEYIMLGVSHYEDYAREDAAVAKNDLSLVDNTEGSAIERFLLGLV